MVQLKEGLSARHRMIQKLVPSFSLKYDIKATRIAVFFKRIPVSKSFSIAFIGLYVNECGTHYIKL